jgi:hypothetical protein
VRASALIFLYLKIVGVVFFRGAQKVLKEYRVIDCFSEDPFINDKFNSKTGFKVFCFELQ